MRKLRHVLPGNTYLITKKCVLDEFVIAPSPKVNEVLLYCLLVAARKHQFGVHGFCFMSNHFHLVVTDRRGTLPDFMRHFLTITSKALNCVLKRSGPIWSSERYSAVQLLDLDAAERKLAYTILNPVRAGLCPRPLEWPGLTSASWECGEEIHCRRPRAHFRSTVAFPEEISGTLESVAIVFQSEEDGTRARIEELVRQALREHRRDSKGNPRRYPTEKSLRSTSRRSRGEKTVRSLNPRFASKNSALLESAISADRFFHAEHRAAKSAWIAGDRNVTFPPGTYGYARFFGAKVRHAA